MDLTRRTPPDPYEFMPEVPGLAVESPGLAAGSALLQHHRGGDGGGVSPALRWAPGPAGTESYAVTAFDPDAPTPGGVHHWVLVDIPATVVELPEGAGGVGRAVLNDLGTRAYVGAEPPPNDRPHRYIFTVHALATPVLPVSDTTSAAFTGFHLTMNAVARGSVAFLG